MNSTNVNLQGYYNNYVFRRSIAAVQHVAITKKNRRKKEYLLPWSYKRCYNMHIGAFFSTAAIVSAQNDVFLMAGFRSADISTLPPLKHIYCGGFMSCHCRMPQNTISIAVVPKNATIGDLQRWCLHPLQKNHCNRIDFLQ